MYNLVDRPSVTVARTSIVFKRQLLRNFPGGGRGGKLGSMNILYPQVHVIGTVVQYYYLYYRTLQYTYVINLLKVGLSKKNNAQLLLGAIPWFVMRWFCIIIF